MPAAGGPAPAADRTAVWLAGQVMARWRRPRGTRRARGRRRRWRRCAGLPRSRRRVWRRCRRCWARQAICRTWSGWPAWRLRERDADPRRAHVVPGRLDQQPAGVGRAGLGDRALASRTGRTDRSDGVSPSHDDQLARRAEALPVAAELEMQRQRGQRVDAAKARAAGRPSATAARRCASRERRSSSASLARDQPVDGGEQVDERQLGRRAARSAGAPSHAGARGSSVVVPAIDAAVREQQLGDPVTGAHQIAADLLARRAPDAAPPR